MIAELALDCRNTHGEGILWDALSARVWWTDIEDKNLWWFDPATSSSGSHGLPDRLCAFAPRRRGGWVMAFASRIELWSSSFQFERVVHDFEIDNPETRLNDGRTDRIGRFVVGGMNEVSGVPDSSVIRVNEDLSTEILLDGIACANSTCFSPDGSRFYFCDTPDRSIRAYDYSGAIGPASQFIDLAAEQGLPDGSCVDAEGGVWNAAWEGGRVIRIGSSGKITHLISVPVPKVTCCAFGGAALDTLYITTSRLGSSAEELAKYPLSGSLFAIRPGLKGLEDTPFAA